MSDHLGMVDTSAGLDSKENRQPSGNEHPCPGRDKQNNLSPVGTPCGEAPTKPEDTSKNSLKSAEPLTPSKTMKNACVACREGVPVFPFTMAFQPIVDLQENHIDAYEALVRGPMVEGAGYVLSQVHLENMYAFDQACRVKAIELAAQLGMDRQLSINFLPNAVYDPRACIQATLKTAARTGFRLDRLTFEILETESIVNTQHLLDIIAEYRKYGFQIALDDFGTGYSGLARLAELKPDVVKIDRLLVQDCDKDRSRLAILSGMIRVCAEIGVKIVIEGVEQAEEVAALRSVGARFIQGFYFAKPLFESIARDADIHWPGP